MIDALIEKISGLFQADYLFGSVLPLLLFLAASGATFAAVVGPADGWELIQGAAIWDNTTLSASLFGIGVIAVSYFLSSLRPLFLKFWSGTSGFILLSPFHHLGRMMQRRAYERLRDRALADSTLWSKELDSLRAKLQGVWDKGTATASQAEVRSLEREIEGLHPDLQESVVRSALDKVVDAYTRCTVASLGEVFRKAQSKLNELAAAEKQRQRLALAHLDRRFGKLESLAPTELGNVIQAYNDYPFERYCMEGEVFWPRLQKVMDSEYHKLLADQQTLLDFSLTSASLGLFYSVLWLVIGPWLWSEPGFWIGPVAAGVLAAYLFYRLGCIAAWKLGDLVRASFDLFRLDLLKALGGVAPETLQEERGVWRRFSTLLVYGGEFTELDGNFKLRTSG